MNPRTFSPEETPAFVSAREKTGTAHCLKRLMGLNAGTTNFSPHIDVLTVAQEGIFTVGVRVTDTEEDLISDKSFDFTVVSGASLVQKNILKG